MVRGSVRGILALLSVSVLFSVYTIAPALSDSSKTQNVKTDSVEQLLTKAEQGDVQAQCDLGYIYYSGQGVIQDYEEAIKWSTKAAEQGFAVAQCNLGIYYTNGQGVPQNYKEAVKWFTKAAEQGDVQAQCNLGIYYSNGKGVPQDYKEAVKWNTKAAEQGYAQAQYNLGVMYYNGQGVPQDYKETVKWFTKAAEQGDVYAQYNMGVMYTKGEGIVMSDKEAVKWYRKAAEQGHTEAQYSLGAMYYNSRGVIEDDKEAAKWFLKAAEQAHAKAQYNLGVMYDNGLGVIEDDVEAYKWMLLAGMNGEDVSEGKVWLQYRMTAGQIAEAQDRAKDFVERKEKEKANGTASADESNSSVTAFGTGFFISKDGLFLTAGHVVKDAESVRIFWKSKDYPAEKVFIDETLDVAVLKVSGIQSPQALSLSSSSRVKTGESVFTLGFPQVQLQGVEAKYTDGAISSLSGIANDPKHFQISVPVQPGNSGGPLMDSSGNVVGLITSRLDEIATLEATGSLPQNVNYALKSSFILPLLESLPGVADQLEKPSKLDKAEAIEKAKNAVGLVVCID
ncbi:MAG: SEL1-like repeat protein [Deltaproteobacteria bacterium]|nr:SEL1-like repeat protein [Deltaproteobacteria bacterium]